jgi:hypothetical protein
LWIAWTKMGAGFFSFLLLTPTFFFFFCYSDIDPYEFIAGFQKKLEFDPKKLKVFTILLSVFYLCLFFPSSKHLLFLRKVLQKDLLKHSIYKRPYHSSEILNNPLNKVSTFALPSSFWFCYLIPVEALIRVMVPENVKTLPREVNYADFVDAMVESPWCPIVSSHISDSIRFISDVSLTTWRFKPCLTILFDLFRYSAGSSKNRSEGRKSNEQEWHIPQ